MNDLSIPAVLDRTGALPAMVERAAQTLASAKTAAEVLDARDMAAATYDAAKRTARFAKAKGAHDELLSKINRAQADALDIEAAAKRRLADEYDAAQERGEIAKIGDNLPSVPKQNSKPTAADVGLTRKEIHEARIIRDAEKADPGIVKRTINAAVDAGEEPTRAAVRRAVVRTVRPEVSAPQPKRGKAAIAARVCDGLAALSGLPPPGEVVGYLRGTDAAVLVDEKLPDAYRWLREFTDLWSEQGEDNAEAAE